MPKNKSDDDAWVKGAQFIDLVGLGMKQDSTSKKDEGAVYIKPNVSAAGGTAAPMNTF